LDLIVTHKQEQQPQERERENRETLKTHKNLKREEKTVKETFV
jgi:hypothetical protein